MNNNMSKKSALIIFLFLSVAISGCTRPEITITFHGEWETSENNFSMRGTIEDEAAAEPNRFANVTVYLFSSNGTILNSTDLGTIDGESSEFSLSSEKSPKYVIIYSQDFAGGAFDYWERTGDGGYTVYSASTEEDLPVNLSE